VDIASRRDVQRSIVMKLDVHDVCEAFMEYRAIVRPSIIICVFEDQDAVCRRPVIIIGPEVRVTFSNKNSPVVCNCQSRWCHDLRMLGKQFDRQPIIAGLRHIGC